MVREQRREQVLDAAKTVFAKKGFHKASVALDCPFHDTRRLPFRIPIGYRFEKADVFADQLLRGFRHIDQR